jgi:hypothetical protein
MFEIIGNILLYGIALACFWVLVATLLKFNIKTHMIWWATRIVPMCIVIMWALYRLGIIPWLEKSMSN